MFSSIVSGRRRSTGTLVRGRALVLAVVTAASAAGAHAASNHLYLDLASGAQQVRYVADAVTVTRPLVTLSGTACQLDGNAPFNQYLTFGSGSSTPGWRAADRRIGVNGISNGAPCTQIRNDQDVTLALGSALDGLKVVQATLNLIVTDKPIRLEVTPRNGATPVVAAPLVVECPAKVPCQIALAGDLPRWDNLRILTTRTQLTGESGAWSISNSTFRLTTFVPEGEFACEDQVDRDGASLRRLFDVVVDGDPQVCTVRIPYLLNVSGSTLEFLADYTDLPEGVEPAFEFDVTTPPERVSITGYGPVPFPITGPTFLDIVAPTVQWFDDATNRYVMDFCPGTPDFTPAELDGEGNVITPAVFNGLTFPDGFDVADGPNDMSAGTGRLEGFQYGCLIDRNVDILEPALCGIEMPNADEMCIQVRERGYLRGDWQRTRSF